MDQNRLFRCRVLAVEDDPLVLQTTASIVRSFGFSVRAAEDGFVALKILREVLPDIILTDLRMPRACPALRCFRLFVAGFLTSRQSQSAVNTYLQTCPLGFLWTIFFRRAAIHHSSFSPR